MSAGMVAVQDPLVWSIILTVPQTPSLSMVSSANLMNSRSLTFTSATLPEYGAIQAVMGPLWLYSHWDQWKVMLLPARTSAMAPGGGLWTKLQAMYGPSKSLTEATPPPPKAIRGGVGIVNGSMPTSHPG